MSRHTAFTVPFSSSLPSTPDSRRSNLGTQRGFYGNTASEPSTTPAGPPPSSTRSFTPAGPPPTSVFGSSQLGSPTVLFGTNADARTTGKRINGSSHGRHYRETQNAPKGTGGVRHKPIQVSEDEDEEEAEEDEEDDDEEGSSSEELGMEVDSHEEDGSRYGATNTYDWVQHGLTPNGHSASGIKRSRGSTALPLNSSYPNGMHGAKPKESKIPMLIRNFTKQIGPAHLDEPDTLVIETEKLVKQLYQSSQNTQDEEELLDIALASVPGALCRLWQTCCKQQPYSDAELAHDIGPGDDEPPLDKAVFLSSLLLQLHHPPAVKGKKAFLSYPGKRDLHLTDSFPLVRTHEKPDPFPKVLLDWLERHHYPYRTSLSSLQSYYPNPTAHPHYWDILLSAVLRGKLADVIVILNASNFKHARTAQDEGQTADGYHGVQLESIERVVSKAIQVLQICPALQDEDWDVVSNDWTIFRRRIEQAQSDLAAFAEGHDRDLDPTDSTFEAENFGMRSTSKALSRSARRAQSRVPWTVYQNLKALYGLLSGGSTEVIAFAQDWVEATIGLAVWWDGEEDEEIAGANFASSRRPFRRSQGQAPRAVDINPDASYQRKLAAAFQRVTDDSDDEAFQINPMNPVEVGLASVFEGNVEGVIQLLHGWSLPIAGAVVEVATRAGWFESAPGNGVVDGFNESDLMVLSYGQPDRGLSRDSILAEYANELSARDVFHDTRLNDKIEGWELAMYVLVRLEDISLANRKIAGLLGKLSLNSDYRVDNVIRICRTFGREKEACDIAERYADTIAESSDKYGTALVYYARSHNVKKVKDVLDLLISLSLVQSVAFPPKSTIDDSLGGLIDKPQESFEVITRLDPEAAELLQFYLSGYATLRKYYDLRDEEVYLQPGQKPKHRPIARKKAAAAALLMVIASAADSIQGGLYDEKSKAVVQVDGLLALLGEVVVFIDQPTRYFSLPQILSLLGIIEALQTVHRRIYDQCKDCLQSTLAAARGSQHPPPAREMMKKSISSLTSSSGFSLVGSSMLGDDIDSFGTSSFNTGTGSAVTNGKQKAKPDDQKRGWDWRTAVKDGSSAEDILRILRLGLAKDVARAWTDGEKI